MHREHIQIALDQIAFVLPGYLAFREINSVERAALVINLRFRGIYVFSDIGFLVIGNQCPSAESNDPAAYRMHRKHHAVIELVDEGAVIAPDAHAHGCKEFRFIAFGQCRPGQCRTVFWRPAEPELVYRGIFQASASEIFISDGTSLRSLQTVLKKLLREIHHQIQALAPLPLRYLFRSLLFFLYLNAVFPRQILERFHISHPLVFHDEAHSRS